MSKFCAVMFIFLAAAPALKAADSNATTTPKGEVYVGIGATLVLPKATLEDLFGNKGDRKVTLAQGSRVVTEELAATIEARETTSALVGMTIGAVLGATVTAILLGKNNNAR